MRKIVSLLIAGITVAAGVLIGTPAYAATTYHYAVGNQTGLVADGAAVNITVESPFVSSADGSNAHSLAELVVQSADLKDRIEVGWRKKTTGTPKLFVYHAINGVGQGYDLCTDYATEPRNTGADLSAYATLPAPGPRFQIVNTGTAWWVAFDLKWVCYFPNSVWTNAGRTFNKVNTVQAYGEVASTLTATPCTDMGDGQFGTSGTAAQIGSYSLQGLTSGGPANFSIYTTPATSVYTVNVVTPGETFRYGGTGYNSSGGTPGSAGSC